MKIKTTKMIIKGVGVALAVGSAIAMTEGCMMGSSAKSTKKMVKRAVSKMEDIADTVLAIM